MGAQEAARPQQLPAPSLGIIAAPPGGLCEEIAQLSRHCHSCLEITYGMQLINLLTPAETASPMGTLCPVTGLLAPSLMGTRCLVTGLLAPSLMGTLCPVTSLLTPSVTASPMGTLCLVTGLLTPAVTASLMGTLYPVTGFFIPQELCVPSPGLRFLL